MPAYPLGGKPMDRASLDVWIVRWSDLVRFEVAEVVTSAEFWQSVKRVE